MGVPRTAVWPVVLLLLGGCASSPTPVRETVVLLPAAADRAGAVVVSVEEARGVRRPPAESKTSPAGEGPGAPGRASGVVTVTTAGGTATLDDPYETAEVTAAGGVSTRTMSESESSRRFGGVLAAQPPRPVSYTLYFDGGTDRLTAESVPVLNQVKAVMATWPAPEIAVIGHTDRLGSLDDNDRLGLQRAEMVKRALVEIGVDGSRIEVVSRGEREPVVPTADEVPEPRNRRVELNVR